MRHLLVMITAVWLCNCTNPDQKTKPENSYYDLQESGVKAGGVKMISIDNGKYQVWTKRIGNNPKIKLLLLHGGPGATHEYFESFESFLPQEGIEFYYYDQLGCGNSDNPEDSTLWDLPRFVEEVEQVRQALALDSTNFYLLGHSWGGILAAEYALKYPQHIKGLVISNMMMDAVAYDKYAEDVLSKQMDSSVLNEIRAMESRGDFSNPRYMELLVNNYYTQHILRMPPEQWPNAVNRAFGKLNHSLYTIMQGPSEFGISGKLETWSVTSRLGELGMPVLFIGAEHDTMDPEHMKEQSTKVKQGSYLYCSKGSHMAMWDDQEHYFQGLVQWLQKGMIRKDQN